MKKNSTKNIFRVIFGLILAFFVISIIFYYAGSLYFKIFMPLFSYAIEQSNRDFEIIEVNLTKTDKIQEILYTVKTHREFVDEWGKSWPSSDVTVGILALSLSIHPIIVFSLLISWPGLSIINKFKAVLLSLPLLIIVLYIDIPSHLLYLLKESYRGIYSGDLLPGTILKAWYTFLNSGGRQFLALFVFIVSVAPFYLKKPHITHSDSDRNELCPCGSGIKYKKCCMN